MFGKRGFERLQTRCHVKLFSLMVLGLAFAVFAGCRESAETPLTVEPRSVEGADAKGGDSHELSILSTINVPLRPALPGSLTANADWCVYRITDPSAFCTGVIGSDDAGRLICVLCPDGGCPPDVRFFIHNKFGEMTCRAYAERVTECGECPSSLFPKFRMF